MAVTAPIEIPLWDGNNTPTIEGQRIFEGVAGEIALSIMDPGFTWEEAGVAENFGNSTGTLRTNAGRVDFVLAEGTAETYGRKDIGAGTITGAFTVDFHFRYSGEANTPFVYCAGATDADASTGVDIGASGNGVLIRYAANVLKIFSITAGSASAGNDLAVAPNTDYYCRLRRNADNTIDFFIYLDAGMTNLHASQIGFAGDSNAYRFLHTMTMRTSFPGRTITCWQNYLDFNGTLYDWIPYSTTSPSPVVPWATLVAQTVIVPSSFHIPENMNSGDDGLLKYKYAANGDALSASLTQAQLKAVGNITITDEVESFKLVVQFISNGLQLTTVVTFARVNALIPEADADSPAEGDVRLGIVYFNGNLTGTAAIPGAPDTRSGVAVDDTVGTAAIPGANDVRLGVPVDDTVGNYVPADPEKHSLGDQYGSLGTEFTGTAVFTSFQLPEEIVVEDSEIIIYEEAS